MPHRQIKLRIHNFDFSLLQKYGDTFYRYRKTPTGRTMEWDLESGCWVIISELDKKSARRIVAINNIYDRVIGFTPGFRP